MPFFDNQVGAILWAQWKSLYGKARRDGGGKFAVTILFSGLWYFAFVAGALALIWFLPAVEDRQTLGHMLEAGLLLALLYWQVIPVLLVSSGLSLEMKRLVVYPVAPHKLFGIEVLLRVTTGIEVLIVMSGAAIGLWRNALVPWWGPPFFLLFAAFNMFLSAGVRDLLVRLLARKGVRELVILFFVTLSALPQLLMTLFPPDTWGRHRATLDVLLNLPPMPWPWSVTAHLCLGDARWWALPALLLWLAGAANFGYRQFLRGLRFDVQEVRAKERETTTAAPWWERLFRLPSLLLPDPLGNLVEKEIRFLSRAPRFRLVFFMGFSFGLIIWMPIILGRGRSAGLLSDNFLTVVSLYAVLLLGEVLFWNSFGFDRQAAQVYYVMPVRLSTVFIGKNIAALFYLFLEITMVVSVCEIISRRYPFSKIIESYAVTFLLAVFLLGAGNLASVHFPRPIDPAQSWRHSNSSRIQFYMLLLYPLMSIPILLAYLARYAFNSQAAFYAVLATALMMGAVFYWVALDSAVETAEARRETILNALSHSEGPVA
jgi:ABC-2 type transport system permease protein